MAHRQQRLLRLALRRLVSAQLEARVEKTLQSAEFTRMIEAVQAGESDLDRAGAALLAGALSR